jgi:hypothetical protein
VLFPSTGLTLRVDPGTTPPIIYAELPTDLHMYVTVLFPLHIIPCLPLILFFWHFCSYSATHLLFTPLKYRLGPCTLRSSFILYIPSLRHPPVSYFQHLNSVLRRPQLRQLPLHPFRIIPWRSHLLAIPLFVHYFPLFSHHACTSKIRTRIQNSPLLSVFRLRRCLSPTSAISSFIPQS